MKLTLFGATGRTGKYVLEQALASGHQVTALVRDPDSLETQHPNMTVIQGDARNAADVRQAVEGADAVISTLGPTRGGPIDIMTVCSHHLLDAMTTHDVKRLIMTTGAGVPAPEDQPRLFNKIMSFLLKTLSRKVYEDSIKGIETITASDLDWTIVRGPMLLDEPYNGNYRAGYVGEGMSGRLSRGNFADFILKQLEDDTYLHKMPVLSDL